MGFFRKLLFVPVPAQGSLQKDLHNLFKRLKVAACADTTENSHLYENERLWILQKNNVVFFAVANS